MDFLKIYFTDPKKVFMNVFICNVYISMCVNIFVCGLVYISMFEAVNYVSVYTHIHLKMATLCYGLLLILTHL